MPFLPNSEFIENIVFCLRVSLLAPRVVFSSPHHIDVYCETKVTGNSAVYINCLGHVFQGCVHDGFFYRGIPYRVLMTEDIHWRTPIVVNNVVPISPPIDFCRAGCIVCPTSILLFPVTMVILRHMINIIAALLFLANTCR